MRINNEADARAAAELKTDALLAPGSGAQQWLEIRRLRQAERCRAAQVGPVYLWYEIAHWRRSGSGHEGRTPGFRRVVDEFADVQWRLRRSDFAPRTAC
jgi:hypothetical protein